MKEELEKALHDIQFAHENLRKAFQKANRVERIVLKSLIMQSHELEREVGELVFAQRDDVNPEQAKVDKLPAPVISIKY